VLLQICKQFWAECLPWRPVRQMPLILALFIIYCLSEIKFSWVEMVITWWKVRGVWRNSQNFSISQATKNPTSLWIAHWQKRWLCWKINVCSSIFLLFKQVKLEIFLNALVKQTSYRPGGGETICPPQMAVRLAVDLRRSGDGSAVRTWLSCRQPACRQPRATGRLGLGRQTDGQTDRWTDRGIA